MKTQSSKKNTSTKTSRPSLPDVAVEQKTSYLSSLNKVGMTDVQLPLLIQSEHGDSIQVPSLANICVNLDSQAAKGIHMSRLYILVCDYIRLHAISPRNVAVLAEKLIESQDGISSRCYLEFKFQYLLQKPSLISGLSGPRYFPIKVLLEKKWKEPANLRIEFKMSYSSTCPCSGRLSEAYIQETMQETMQQGIIADSNNGLQNLQKPPAKLRNHLTATPHAQRSEAEILLEYRKLAKNFNFADIIKKAERCIVTPVQTVVKRSDELQFAKLNAENMMFCEDAARILKKHFDNQLKIFKDYTIKVTHFESLHAHNTMAIARKD